MFAVSKETGENIGGGVFSITSVYDEGGVAECAQTEEGARGGGLGSAEGHGGHWGGGGGSRPRAGARCGRDYGTIKSVGRNTDNGKQAVRCGWRARVERAGPERRARV